MKPGLGSLRGKPGALLIKGEDPCRFAPRKIQEARKVQCGHVKARGKLMRPHEGLFRFREVTCPHRLLGAHHQKVRLVLVPILDMLELHLRSRALTFGKMPKHFMHRLHHFCRGEVRIAPCRRLPERDRFSVTAEVESNGAKRMQGILVARIGGHRLTEPLALLKQDQLRERCHVLLRKALTQRFGNHLRADELGHRRILRQGGKRNRLSL